MYVDIDQVNLNVLVAQIFTKRGVKIRSTGNAETLPVERMHIERKGGTEYLETKTQLLCVEHIVKLKKPRCINLAERKNNQYMNY